MKINIKNWAIASGIMWSIVVAWIIIIAMLGKGTTVFEGLNQLYLNLIDPTVPGLVIGVVLAFIDAFLFGAIFAWIYNKLAK